jgi:hypothetical protein
MVPASFLHKKKAINKKQIEKAWGIMEVSHMTFSNSTLYILRTLSDNRFK